METVRPVTLTVSQLNNQIKGLIDDDYRFKSILVCGEISNFTNHVRSGHFYMTLKDDKSAIKAVMFRTYAQRLKFMPENGIKVLVRGSVSVYERDGQYQLYIEDMIPDGYGALNLAYEQLRDKLEKEGLFDPRYKKSLPKYPRVIGVVTSPTGAAFQDIRNVLKRRWPLAIINICPAQVQGEAAPMQIVNAIRTLDNQHRSDVIIVARGGGSIEDLWAFNNEAVAREIFRCSTPVVSGVGHETDFTIADFVADRRAPTPSAAAEIVVPDYFSELEYINQLSQRSRQILLRKISTERANISKLTSRNVMRGPTQLINERRLLLDSYIDKMNMMIENSVRFKRSNFTNLVGKLNAYSPLNVISRGYSVAKSGDRLIKSIEDVKKNDEINLRVSDGSLKCTVNELIPSEE